MTDFTDKEKEQLSKLFEAFVWHQQQYKIRANEQKKKMHHRFQLSIKWAVDRIIKGNKDLAKQVYIDAYERGHHDTVESQYTDAEEAADEWIAENMEEEK